MANIPEAKPGRVIRYEYLWRNQAKAGQEHGQKDRPACILLSIDNDKDGKRVLIVPITHTPPSNDSLSYEIPSQVKQYLNLDDERSWVILSEANIDVWPSPDLRPIPNNRSSMEYGLLPQKMLNAMRNIVLNAILEKSFTTTDREGEFHEDEGDYSIFQGPSGGIK
jgi:mRNA-degrading endonuclease toxin of MazEF toxin-antitoxin module